MEEHKKHKHLGLDYERYEVFTKIVFTAIKKITVGGYNPKIEELLEEVIKTIPEELTHREIFILGVISHQVLTNHQEQFLLANMLGQITEPKKVKAD